MYGSVWTIQYEAACYLGLALLGCLGVLGKRWIALAILLLDLVVCAFLSIADQFGWSVSLDPTYPRLLAYFGAGMVFYLYRDRVPTKSWALSLAIGLVAAGLITPVALNVALPLGGCYLLFWCAFQPYFKLQNFARRGDYSYGIYLYAFPIQQILISLSPAAWSPLGLFFVATPASILAGALSWHLVEKHFLTKRIARVWSASGAGAGIPYANAVGSQTAISPVLAILNSVNPFYSATTARADQPQQPRPHHQ
jgi:peptidoglycan/LPS O-acetylase OafA/YrhL